MEYFNKAGVVRLRSHLGKYLVADEDNEKVLQSRTGSIREATWMVELIEGKSHRVKLRNYNGRYLTATDKPFLTGVTGDKVVQADFDAGLDWKYEWEPISVDGLYVKLRSWCGKYLRGNGGVLPWRNSITHDNPYTSVTHNWILWSVETLEPQLLPQKMVSLNNSVEYSSFDSDDDQIFYSESPLPRLNSKLQTTSSTNLRSGMDLFHRAKAVRLRSHHEKYLHAEEDEESVTQDRNGSSKNASWSVELIPGNDNIIRLKSCYGKYLTASNQPLLLGMTGRKVVQSLPHRLESSVEWEPIRDGDKVKLKTRNDNFLRANGGLPPWRNTVTYDIPHRTATQDWILWDVDTLDIHVESSARH
ncbi:hypothetical protein VNO77_04180 [Canavalia gladiata]|uniref:DUF569 domain-containing protein n=1 Tax=Canavalia gladiata TaxID=3824 RepID=A0AAN9MW26_CANGL